MKSTLPIITLALAATLSISSQGMAQPMASPYGPPPGMAPAGAPYGDGAYGGAAYPYYTAAGPTNYFGPAPYPGAAPPGAMPYGPGYGPPPGYGGGMPGYGPVAPTAHAGQPLDAPALPGYGAPGYGAPGPLPPDSQSVLAPDGYGYPGAADTYGGGYGAGADYGTGTDYGAGPDCGYGGCSWWAPFQASVEYLYMTRRGSDLPPLVTSGPSTAPFNEVGRLGRLGTRVLFGGEEDPDRLSGGRATLGMWFDCTCEVGAWVRVWGVNEDETLFSAVSGGNPPLAIPFFNAAPSLIDPTLPIGEDALVIAFPGIATGSINIEADTDIWSFETYATVLLNRGCGWRLDLLGGYHQTRIDQHLAIRSFSTLQNPPPPLLFPSGTTRELVDTFSTRNEFKGGELGMIGEIRQGCYSARVLFKSSLGNMEQQATVRGQTTFQTPQGDVFTAPTGLFAQESNSGTFVRDKTVAIPEFSVTLGYDITPHWKITSGYTIVWWSEVLQPGELIDRVIDPTQADPTQNPAFTFEDSNFWVSGLSFGTEYRY